MTDFCTPLATSNFCFADILFANEHERIHFAPQTNKFSYALGSRLIFKFTRHLFIATIFQHMVFWIIGKSK